MYKEKLQKNKTNKTNKIKQAKNKLEKGIIVFIILLAILEMHFVYAFGQPALVRKLKSAFEQIYGYILAVSTPAAAVAVASGLIMKKFSFGEEERIRTAKRLIRGSLFAYGFILCSKLVIDLITALLK